MDKTRGIRKGPNMNCTVRSAQWTAAVYACGKLSHIHRQLEDTTDNVAVRLDTGHHN